MGVEHGELDRVEHRLSDLLDGSLEPGKVGQPTLRTRVQIAGISRRVLKGRVGKHGARSFPLLRLGLRLTLSRLCRRLTRNGRCL